MKTNLSFEEALQETSRLLQDCYDGQLFGSDLEDRIAGIVSTPPGARGFLVNYLTSENPFTDKLEPPVLNALSKSPEVVCDLLAKNLVMSTTMALTHQRNGDEESKQGSLRVQRRTSAIIDAMTSEQMRDRLEQMWRSLTQGNGEYADFLHRWHYDQEQLEKAQEALRPLRHKEAL